MTRRVFRDRITPHWFAGNSRFWYCNTLPGGAKEYIRVDAERGVREPAFDHAKLAASLSAAAGADCRADRLTLDDLEFADDGGAVRFAVNGVSWRCDLTNYECGKVEATATNGAGVKPGTGTGAEEPRRRRRGLRARENADRSPDGQWMAFVKDHNVFIRSNDNAAAEIQLSHDGKEGLSYGRLSWAPDSKSLVAFRIEPGDRKEVYLVQSSPPGGGRAKLQSRPYPFARRQVHNL